MDVTTLLIAIISSVGTLILGLLSWSIQRHITSTNQNTIAIAVLTNQMSTLSLEIERMREAFYRLDRAEKDLNEAHKKLREIQGQLN
jgi:hypothetical protein